MGLRKEGEKVEVVEEVKENEITDTNSENNEVNEQENSENDVSYINNLIEENTKLEEEEKDVSLDELEIELTNNANLERTSYLKETKKVRNLNIIIVVIAMVLMVGGFVLLLTLGNTYGFIIYIALALVLVGLIGMFVTLKIVKSKLGKKAQAYIDKLFTLTNNFIYSDSKFSDINYVSNAELDTNVFKEAKLYKDVKSSRSRNYCTVTYENKTLTSCDLAANVIIKNKTMPYFLGKFYVYENDFEEDGKYIIFQLRGGNLSRPIDDIDDLKLVEGDKNIVVYSNYEKYKKILTLQVITLLKTFRIDSTLIDVVVSIRKGYTCIGIDYSDDFLTIPVDSEFKINYSRRAKQDLDKVVEILSLIKYK